MNTLFSSYFFLSIFFIELIIHLLVVRYQDLTSASDWHDFMVLAVSLSAPTAVNTWLESFHGVYKLHADRVAFPVLEPRPAIIEASLRHKRLLFTLRHMA